MRLLVVLVLTILSAAAGAMPVVFEDDTFVDADWTVVTSSFEVNGKTVLPGGTATGVQVPAGGNPGAFREVTHVVPAAPSPTTFGATWSAHFRVGFVYDPSVQGPIANIDFDEDARRTSGSALGQSTGLAIRQGGKVYVVQAGTTPEAAWTHKQLRRVTAPTFGVLEPNGFPGGSIPDFSAAGGPIEVGFVRGNSTGAGGASYTIAAAIDNWQVRLNPPCATPAECDDGDACTVDQCTAGTCGSVPLVCDDGDACVAGTCQAAPIDCDDGGDCTADGCVAGACQHTPGVSYAFAQAKAQELVALLQGAGCGEEALSKRLVRKLKSKILKVGVRARRVDGATKAALVNRLLRQADRLLDVAGSILQKAVVRGDLTPACAAVLQGFVDELRQCMGT